MSSAPATRSNGAGCRDMRGSPATSASTSSRTKRSTPCRRERCGRLRPRHAADRPGHRDDRTRARAQPPRHRDRVRRAREPPLHGALLDARILADVYLAMTGGQSALALTEQGAPPRGVEGARGARVPVRPAAPLAVLVATPDELEAHEAMLALITRESGGRCLWASELPDTPAVGLPAAPEVQRAGV